MLNPSNTYAFRLFIMKVMLDVFSLCESAADIVGPTMEVFKKRRSKGNFVKATKLNAIVDAIMAKPKKFLNLSMENLLILSGMEKKQLREKIYLAVKNLGRPQSKSVIQATIFESDDERELRGNF